MQPQLILRIVGIAALVVAALFAVLAVHYYLTQNIRAVMDDLSGKTRAQGVAGARTRTAADARSAAHRTSRQATSAPGAPTSAPDDARADEPRRAEVSPAVFQAVAFEDQDDAGTVLVGALHAGETDAARASVASSPQPAPTADIQPLFRLTRSIVLIHSQEVIATSEEPLV